MQKKKKGQDTGLEVFLTWVILSAQSDFIPHKKRKRKKNLKKTHETELLIMTTDKRLQKTYLQNPRYCYQMQKYVN